jgi:transposase
MKTTRKRYTGEFKARVALEAIRGDRTLAELAAKHGIHPTMIATWKRQAIEAWRRSSRALAKRPRPQARPI